MSGKEYWENIVSENDLKAAYRNRKKIMTLRSKEPMLSLPYRMTDGNTSVPIKINVIFAFKSKGLLARDLKTKFGRCYITWVIPK